MLIGMHLSTSGGVEKSVLRANELGCNTFQIFISNPRGWSKSTINNESIKLFKGYLSEAKIINVFAHSIYLINLATENKELYHKSIESLIDGLKTAKSLGLSGLVTHIGSHGGSGLEEGLKRVKTALNEVFSRTYDCPPLLLENTAGAGSLIGTTIEELADIYQQFKDKNIGICLDTAHGFEYGYDFDSKEGLDDFVRKFDKSIGLNALKVIHLNDSLTEKGSNRDRHAEFGEGLIGLKGMKRIIDHPKLKDLPFIMETPKLREGIEGAEFISSIKKLANG